MEIVKTSVSLLDDPRIAQYEPMFFGLSHYVPAIVWAASANGIFDHANTYFQDFAELSPLGKAAWQTADLIDEADLERVSKEVQKAFAEQNAFTIECRLRSRSGESLPFILRGAPVRRRDWTVYRWLGTAVRADQPSCSKPTPEDEATYIMGLTHEQQLIMNGAYGSQRADEFKAERLAKRLQFLADASRELSSTLDSQTVLYNLARLATPKLGDWACLLELHPDGALQNVAHFHRDPAFFHVGWTTAMKYCPPNVADIKHGSYYVMRERKPQLQRTCDASVITRLGLNHEYMSYLLEMGFQSWLIAPLFARGQVVGTVTFGMSTPDRQYDESDLAFACEFAQRLAMALENSKLYHEAQKVNRTKDEFLATLSHELRTPLNVIMGYSELLSTSWNDMAAPEIRTSLDAVQRNSRSQLQIIDDLLNVSSMILGKVELKPTRFSLTDLVQKTVESLRMTLGGKELHIDFDSVAVEITGDPNRIQQIVTNLLTNAIKYTPSGGHINIVLTEENGEAHLQFKDTGIGIDAEFLPYVFDRFRQEDNSSTRNYGGLGLGLSIVRNLVEMHGGRVDVQSRGRDYGSIFKVTLPIGSKPELANRISLEIPRSTLQDLYGIQVLLVEDDTDTRHLLTRILERAGCRVYQAASAYEGFRLFSLYYPDVILSDIGMSGEDGVEFIRRVRQAERHRSYTTPAAALTAYTRPEDAARAIHAGFQIHIAKPVNRGTLISAVCELVANSDSHHMRSRI